MDRAVNMDSFLAIYNTENEELIESFIKLDDNGYNHEDRIGMSNYELEDLAKLFNNLSSVLNASQKNGYYLGFKVSAGLCEEFDILRFSNYSVLNIELKHTIPSRGLVSIKDQLIRHRYLLSVLNKKVNLFTFISDLSKVYMLTTENDLIEVNICELIEFVDDDYLFENELSHKDLSDLIISPYSQPKLFAEHVYFLTNEQSEISKKIFNSKSRKIGLIGGAGTGKSMVLFDLAKKYQNKGLKVVVIFCSPLLEYISISEQIGVSVIPIVNVDLDNLTDYDVILVDEAQRLWKDNFDILWNKNKELIIFSADHQQTLHPAEKNLNIEGYLKNSKEALTVELRNKYVLI